MEKSLCRLNLVCSPDGAERLIETLLEQGDGAPAFTSWPARGHGHDFAGATVGERVRGHVNRIVIVLVIRRAEADHLLEEIAQQSSGQNMTFWIEPVETFGQLGHNQDLQDGEAPSAESRAEAEGRPQ